MDYEKKDERLLAFDRKIVCKFDPICYEKGMISK
jgi:polyphosphate kinase